MTEAFKRRKEDKLPGRILKFINRFFIVMGIGATFCFALMLMTLSQVSGYTPPALPDKILLTYDFESGLSEVVGKPSLHQPLLRPATTLQEVVEALDHAAKDDRVKGFAARMKDAQFNVAQIQELRDAILKFRETGKFAYIYSDSFGGFSSGMGDYYLASAFDQIWLQPIGVVAVNGIAMEVPFVKGLLDKIGVSAQFGHKGTYKSAPESLTLSEMSKPHREMMESLARDISGQIEEGISKTRPFDKALIDQSPFTDKEALDKKLVDKIGYYDEMLDAAREKAELDAEIKTVELTGYSFVDGTTKLNLGMGGYVAKFAHKTAPASVYKDKAIIALVYGVGDIVPFSSSGSFAGFGEGGMSAEKIVEAFQSVTDDENVAAVVFRIDSPGGSPEAAESIRRAILLTQKKGKPVVVSMGGYAASGGYWVAAPADKIVAQPGTLTGSIGVFGGKLEMSGLWDKLGVNWDSVAEGKNARMWSSNKPFTDAEFEKFESMLGNIYDSFIDRVAEGRGLSKDKVGEIAEGRVWTGKQAKEIGLVDELGGLNRAVEIAKELAKLDPAQEVPVLQYPPKKSTLEMFIDLATEGADAGIGFSDPKVFEFMQGILQRQESLALPRVDLR